MSSPSPHIRIARQDGRIVVEQQRPTVTGILGGLSLEEAVLRIPLLLPICGHAQGIAAQRAAFAARSEADPCACEHTRQLWREQGVAAAWRLTIDWPAALDRERDLALFKAAQNADGATSLATYLQDCLPGLISIEEPDDLMRWVNTSHCTAASMMRRAMELEADLGVPRMPNLAAGETLQAMSQAALAAADFNPLSPSGAGIEVGALAMHRHPMAALLTTSPLYGALSRRLIAQLLDTLVIAGNLLDEQSTYPVSAWTLLEGVGLGRAVTARGPLFHRVALDGDGRVEDWRVLAPTDWHFAPGGPLEIEANRGPLGQEQLRLLVLGFDPCSPWTLQEEVAHA